MACVCFELNTRVFTLTDLERGEDSRGIYTGRIEIALARGWRNFIEERKPDSEIRNISQVLSAVYLSLE